MARPPVFKVPEKQRIVLAVRAPVAARRLRDAAHLSGSVCVGSLCMAREPI
jgi:hypothetical protein